MNHKKLLLTLTLTLCLCALLCMVVTASASEVSVHTNHFSCGVVGCQNNDHGHTQVTEWKGWDGTSEIVYTEGTAYIYLTRDVTFDQIFQISSGNTLYLCLNGKKIEMQGGNNVLAANSGSKLVLCDCQRNGSITHGVDNNGKKAEGGGVNVIGTFVMYSGTISDNMTGDYYYGAVTVNNDAVFKMYGGSISGNQCTSTGGAGGVYVFGGTFEMYGGTITGNTYTQDVWPGGGGVSINNVSINDKGTFTMSGGAITNNTASGNAESGGGVYFGGGIRGGTFSVSGNITITGNTKNGTANNVFLSGSPITVVGFLTGSPIGVTTSNTPDKNSTYCTYFDFAKASSANLLENAFTYENDSAIYIGTCTFAGATYLRACAHKDSSLGYEKEDAQHWQKCSDCGYEGTKTGHIYSQEKMTDTYKASDATCTTPVTYYYSCVCGAKGTNTFNSTKTNEQAKGHAYVDHAAQDPTCTEDGWAAYKTCERCDYTSKEIKPKLNHVFANTWEHNDDKHWHKCTRDGCTGIDAEAAHEWQPATYTAPKTCTVCGATQGEPLTRSYYYYAPSAAEDKKDSPKAGDPGVLLYAGLALASLTGLACTAKKRH